MFCLDEPDRHPGFTRRERPDARVRRAQRRPADPVRAARPERVADRGGDAAASTPAPAASSCIRARRSSPPPTTRLGPVFALAAERRVPILIHGGRGLPPIADGLRALVDRYPDATLIIAHAGIADLAALARCMAGRKGVLFDTSTWSPIDLLDFYRQVPPEQVVYASDYPYGQQPVVAADRAEDRAARRATRRAAARDARRHRERARRRAASCPSRRRRSAATRSRSRCSSRASTSTSRWRRRSSGRASPTRSACSGSRSTPAPSGTATSRRVDRIRELLESPRATSGRRCPTLEDEAEQRTADAADASG